MGNYFLDRRYKEEKNPQNSTWNNFCSHVIFSGTSWDFLKLYKGEKMWLVGCYIRLKGCREYISTEIRLINYFFSQEKSRIYDFYICINSCFGIVFYINQQYQVAFLVLAFYRIYHFVGIKNLAKLEKGIM